MHLKSNTNKDLLDNSLYHIQTMASSLLNDDEDNATRNTQQTQQQQQQQQQQSQNNNNNNIQCANVQHNNLTENNSTTTNSSKMQENEAKLKKKNLEDRKLELEKLLNEKSWLLQQLQKQETQILQGNFEYMNFNDFIQNLALQYNLEKPTVKEAVRNGAAVVGGEGGSLGGGSGEEAIFRHKPLAAKENQHNNSNNNNVLYRRQSEISNRSSEYDNYPQHDNHSTHSDGGRSVMQGAAQATQQYAAKSALKKRSATVAGTTAQSSSNLQMIRQQHLEQQQLQQQQQLLYKQQQQLQQQQQLHQHQLQQHHLYHQTTAHPQQHLFKPHPDHHQVLMPHLQYATQKFYYTTLQPQQTAHTAQQQQQQYGRYIQNKQIAQQQTQSPNQQHYLQIQTQQQSSPQSQQQQQQQQQQQHLFLTPPSHSSTAGQVITMDNISLYSLNSNNVATLHRPAQQQQPIIVQCDKYYLSPTSHHASHNDGAGFIKSSQNIKEYVSPLNSPQHLMQRDKSRIQTSQTNLTPSLDAISLAPSYVSMETIEYATSPSHQPITASNAMRWRSQSNLPPIQNMPTSAQELKSQSQDMLNNNQYYNTALKPPPPPPPPTTFTLLANSQGLPPQVTQVKPFKPFDDISQQSFNTDTQKKSKPKQWLESSLDGPAIRQNTPHNEEISSPTSSLFQRTKLSSQSLNTSRHYSMSAAQTKPMHSHPSNVAANTKLSQSTSYLNQMDPTNITPTIAPAATPSISQAYNLELSPQTPMAYKYLTSSSSQQQQQQQQHQQQLQPQQKKSPVRPAPSALYVNTLNTNNNLYSTPTPSPAVAAVAALSPDIRIESPVNVTIVQPATFQPYKEVTKPFEMSDFYKYSTKFRQKENTSNNNNSEN